MLRPARTEGPESLYKSRTSHGVSKGSACHPPASSQKLKTLNVPQSPHRSFGNPEAPHVSPSPDPTSSGHHTYIYICIYIYVYMYYNNLYISRLSPEKVSVVLRPRTHVCSILVRIPSYELLSKLLVSPLITPIVVPPYMIPYITPL